MNAPTFADRHAPTHQADTSNSLQTRVQRSQPRSQPRSQHLKSTAPYLALRNTLDLNTDRVFLLHRGKPRPQYYVRPDVQKLLPPARACEARLPRRDGAAGAPNRSPTCDPDAVCVDPYAHHRQQFPAPEFRCGRPPATRPPTRALMRPKLWRRRRGEGA